MCNNAIGSVEFYDHAKTEEWNSSIIVSCIPTQTRESKGRTLTLSTSRTPF